MIYHFKLTKLSRNTVIFREDEESTRLYIVKSGEVKISKVLSVKQEIAFDEVGPPRSIKKLFEVFPSVCEQQIEHKSCCS